MNESEQYSDEQPVQAEQVSQPSVQKHHAREEKEFKGPSNTVYIGKKPPSVYAFATVTQFNNGQNEVFIKARGKSIVAAVNVSQMVKHKFIPTLKIGKIELGTEELTSEDGKVHRVSSILIPLTKE